MSDDDITELVRALHPRLPRPGALVRRRGRRPQLLAAAGHHRGRGRTRCCSWPSCAPGSGCWTAITETEGFDRILRDGPGLRRLDDGERAAVVRRVRALPRLHPGGQEVPRGHLRGQGRGRAGPGSASAAPGLPAYTVLIEGYNQALDNDVVLSMKQGNVAAPSRVVTDPRSPALPPPRAPHGAVPARAAGARRPAAGLDRPGRRRLRGQRGVPVRGRPGLVRAHRAGRDRAGGRLPGPGDREGALRRRLRRRPLARRRSRPRTRSPASSAGREDEFVEWVVEFAHDYAARSAPTTRCSWRRSGPGRSPASPPRRNDPPS